MGIVLPSLNLEDGLVRFKVIMPCRPQEADPAVEFHCFVDSLFWGWDKKWSVVHPASRVLAEGAKHRVEPWVLAADHHERLTPQQVYEVADWVWLQLEQLRQERQERRERLRKSPATRWPCWPPSEADFEGGE